MPTDLIVVENRKDWKVEYDGTVITAQEYITKKKYFNHKPLRLINLCRDYKYLSVGYYCSLLAEARGHKAIPSVKTMLELSNRTLYQHGIAELEQLVRRSLVDYPTTSDIDLPIFFGQVDQPPFKKLAAKVFEQYRCPLILLKLCYQGGRWKIQSMRLQLLQTMPAQQRDFFLASLNTHTKQRWLTPKIKNVARYDLAVLHNPQEQLPPSNRRALEKFIRIGKAMDINVELIEKKHFSSLYEFDALFIRETTGIDHHTFRFAKKAEREGMVVIDDPDSIFKCTNKVYLAELLKTHKIKTPKTIICDYNGFDMVEQEILYPVVLKIPDGSFSRGVHKAKNRLELEKIGAELLKESDLILAQEYLYTEYDWRIGVLNYQPIFACKYYMSHHHWQVVKYGSNGKMKEGLGRTLPLTDVPPKVLATAVHAASVIGDGFYGVDLKQREQDVWVIEVNDNPSIEAGLEDACLKDDLYRIILNDFIRRLNAKWAG